MVEEKRTCEECNELFDESDLYIFRGKQVCQDCIDAIENSDNIVEKNENGGMN